MSDQPKETPYVYQPYGIQHKEHHRFGRLWAVATDSHLTRIDGLTQIEASAICDALIALRTPGAAER